MGSCVARTYGNMSIPLAHSFVTYIANCAGRRALVGPRERRSRRQSTMGMGVWIIMLYLPRTNVGMHFPRALLFYQERRKLFLCGS